MCRDVQEEILAAEEHAQLIDIVDVKYWWYTPEGDLYDPPGGQNLAPRQQLRAWTGPKSNSAESICQSIRDLKARFPEKAVVCSLPAKSPWMLLAAGCSLPELPNDSDQNLLRDLVQLRPETSLPEWSLVGVGEGKGNPRRMTVSTKAVSTAPKLDTEAKGVNAQTGKLELISELSTQDYSDENPYVLWIKGAN